MDPFTSLVAVAAPLDRPNVDTDQLIPARFLDRRRHQGMGDCLFHDLRLDANGNKRADFVLNESVYSTARILVAGRNFGCGSSREHAVFALIDSGIFCVIAPSFGDIFYSNSFKNGLLPVVLSDGHANELLHDLQEQVGASVSVDLPEQRVTGPKGRAYAFEIDPFHKECLLRGLDEIELALAHIEDIESFERSEIPSV